MESNASIIKPQRLGQGDRIGVIAPAGPVNESDLQPGLSMLESSGFAVYVAPHVYYRHGYLAGDDEMRLADLHAIFEDKEIKAVLCARGGYGSLRILDRINYGLIKENPKIIAGYSDITALLMGIQRKTGLVTFHGPMVQEFASGDKNNWNSLCSLISSNKPLKMDLREGTVLIQGSAVGPLIGGNLSMIIHLLGTPFLPFLDGCILFIEEKGESLYRLDRMLTHFALSGQLQGISGLIAGEFVGCGDRFAVNRLLMDKLSDMGVPLITGLSVGHGAKNLALPIGVMADLNTDLMTLTIMEECVR